MRQLLVGFLALALCNCALAQISQEDAAKKLAEKKAARDAARAVTVSVTQGDLDDLRDEINRLRAQVAKFQALLADEKKKEAAAAAKEQARIAAEAKAKEDPDPIAEAIRSRTLAIGMTIDQANRAMGVAGTKTGESKDGVEYSWAIQTGTGLGGNGGNGSGMSRRLFNTTRYRKATFKDGMLVEFHTDT